MCTGDAAGAVRGITLDRPLSLGLGLWEEGQEPDFEAGCSLSQPFAARLQVGEADPDVPSRTARRACDHAHPEFTRKPLNDLCL
jgi:hypothetical protein